VLAECEAQLFWKEVSTHLSKSFQELEIEPGFKREERGCLKEGYPSGISTIFNAKSTHQKDLSGKEKAPCREDNRFFQPISVAFL